MTRLLQACLLAALALLALWHAPEARAATTCTASLSSWNVTVGSTGHSDAIAYVTYNCNTSTGLSWRDRATVKMCLAIGPGSVASSTVGNRLLANSFNESLQFQIYRDAARTQVLGSSATNPAFLELDTFEYPLQSFLGLGANGSASGTFPIYGRVPAQSGLAAGNYSSSFGTTLRYRYRELQTQSDPVTCESGGGAQGSNSTFNFTATATIPNHCTIDSAGDLDFGSVMSTSTGEINRTSAIRLTCTRRTPWQIGLNQGLNASGAARRMAGPNGSFIEYQLHRNPGWGDWGTTLNTNTASGTGDGTSQSVTVYGRITNQFLTQGGSYSDTVTVIVTY